METGPGGGKKGEWRLISLRRKLRGGLGMEGRGVAGVGKLVLSK